MNDAPERHLANILGYICSDPTTLRGMTDDAAMHTDVLVRVGDIRAAHRSLIAAMGSDGSEQDRWIADADNACPCCGGSGHCRDVRAALCASGQQVRARPLDEWHEDMGYAVWWCWSDGDWLGEPAWIGSPLCEDWPDYHTHFTPHPAFPAALTPAPDAAQAEAVACGGCGAKSDAERCMGCLHDFGTSGSSWVRKHFPAAPAPGIAEALATELDEAWHRGADFEKDYLENIRTDLFARISDFLRALKGGA